MSEVEIEDTMSEPVVSAALPEPSENGQKAKRHQKREKLGEELAMELDALRAVLGEMIDRYRFRIEGALVEVSSAARGEQKLDGKGTRLRANTAQKMLTQIREAGIKPKKGRAKDFQRLEELVDELTEQLPNEQ